MRPGSFDLGRRQTPRRCVPTNLVTPQHSTGPENRPESRADRKRAMLVPGGSRGTIGRLVADAAPNRWGPQGDHA